jgi:hypothetical protein
MSNNQTNDVLDSILDSSLDDLSDLPEFAVFPAGVHKVTLKFESKMVNDHPAVEMGMTLVDTLEMSNSDEQPLAAGAESSVLFMLDNEFGQGKLKLIAKPLAEHFGVGNIKAVMEAANGMEVVVTTKVRQNKDKSQTYTDVTKVIIE